ncbi:ATP-binding cassette domain-containing protein [Halomonas sp. M4R5S39]|uniref:ATP-binding cassette domain-containing protein n=1 Tax=Halomonas kalidii TaxID=3043293 RepID=UPI0024A9C076|nr:ATP-binding cassette domain-containing protein [Halomonas kalidii]MDI5986189.1 ATP-binding cassette domain-containing protein [Halomonas kalidii]
MTAAIRTSGLGRRFAGRPVLTGVDLEVQQGDIFGLLGPDGAGKTTLMQLLAAILDPSAGQATVLGFDTVHQAAEVNARVGYMSQGFALYDRLSVLENLQFAARIRGVEAQRFAGRSHELLAMAGLQAYLDRPAGKLSGGMRKKLSLCANLIHAPPLLLLDELSLGVDPVSRRELWQLLRRYQQHGSTVVVSTPYMDEAEYCDRLAFLDQGRVLAVDTPTQLRARVHGRIYDLRTSMSTAVQEILRDAPQVLNLQWLADRLRIQLHPGTDLPPATLTRLRGLATLAPAAPGLEEAFIALSTATAPAAPPPVTPAVMETQGGEVRAEQLSVRFGDFTAVDRVAVRVPPGEVIGWLGPNGAGKTTLMRVFCGLLMPSDGEAFVAGLSVTRQARALRSRIGYMSQRFSLYPDLTVAENLRFFAGAYGLGGTRRRQSIDWASGMTALIGMEARRVSELSAAVRQRLALACSILHGPAVLFLDEPTSGVDPLNRQRFWQLIQTLAGGGMTVFVTTHYLEEASYCHRLGLMHQGRLVALGTLEQLRQALRLPADAGMEAVFLGHIEHAQRELA